MTILEQAKSIADEYASEIGGVWVVLGNPNHNHTEMRDVCITEEFSVPVLALDGDVVLYRAEAA